MRVEQLWLTDFRSYAALAVSLAPGLTCIVGNNGIGKTNVLEALAYVATLESFRGADAASMIGVGADRAFVRAAGGSVHRNSNGEPRDLLVETELVRKGRGRVQVNRKRLTRTADLLDLARVTVFSPDDLELVKGGPAERRELMDSALVAVQPGLDGLRRDYAKILKQRNALLRGAKGRLDADAMLTLEVFNDRLAAVGERLGSARVQLLVDIAPYVSASYEHLAGSAKAVELRYRSDWLAAGLHESLISRRDEEIRRQTSLVGPHRDDMEVWLGGLPARSHASQGEQRSLALALRLGVHLLVADTVGMAPLLLLDDVFSELDAQRSAALFRALPEGQAVLTSAVELPADAEPERVYRAEPGRLVS